MQNLRIRSKMLLWLLTTTVIIYISTILYISWIYRTRSLEDATNMANTAADESAYLVQSKINEFMGMGRSLAYAFHGNTKLSMEERMMAEREILERTLLENPEFMAVFAQWELSFLDPDYPNDYGRKRSVYHRYDSIPSYNTERLDLEGDDKQGIYYFVKKTGKEYISDPYFYNYSQPQAIPTDYPTTTEDIIEATLIIPILIDGKYVGMTGMDFPLTSFKEIVENIKPFDKSYCFVIANNGNIVAHP